MGRFSLRVDGAFTAFSSSESENGSSRSTASEEYRKRDTKAAVYSRRHRSRRSLRHWRWRTPLTIPSWAVVSRLKVIGSNALTTQCRRNRNNRKWKFPGSANIITQKMVASAANFAKLCTIFSGLYLIINEWKQIWNIKRKAQEYYCRTRMQECWEIGNSPIHQVSIMCCSKVQRILSYISFSSKFGYTFALD